jgi:hypothetical protein
MHDKINLNNQNIHIIFGSATNPSIFQNLIKNISEHSFSKYECLCVEISSLKVNYNPDTSEYYNTYFNESYKCLNSSYTIKLSENDIVEDLNEMQNIMQKKGIKKIFIIPCLCLKLKTTNDYIDNRVILSNILKKYCNGNNYFKYIDIEKIFGFPYLEDVTYDGNHFKDENIVHTLFPYFKDV